MLERPQTAGEVSPGKKKDDSTSTERLKMAKKKIKHPIPGGPQGQPGQDKPVRTIPADIDNDVDNMIEALFRIKKDWKLLMSGFAGATEKGKELETKIETMKKKKK